MRPDVGCSKPPIIRSVVVLPQPDGPEEAEELAVVDLEVDVVDGVPRRRYVLTTSTSRTSTSAPVRCTCSGEAKSWRSGLDAPSVGRSRTTWRQLPTLRRIGACPGVSNDTNRRRFGGGCRCEISHVVGPRRHRFAEPTVCAGPAARRPHRATGASGRRAVAVRRRAERYDIDASSAATPRRPAATLEGTRPR